MSDADRAPVAVSTEAASTDRPHHGPGRERTLSGWGRVALSRAEVIEVRDADEVAAVLAAQHAGAGGVVARGAGRSYGDAAQNAGGTVLDVTALNRIVSIAGERGLVRVQAGVSYAQLLTELAAHNLMLPVVALRVCTPAGGFREITPETEPELFLATLGGMGLLGVIVEATLRVERLESPWWAVDSDRTGSLDETLALMRDDRAHRYSVAWLDLLAGGSRLGRAVVMRS